MTTKENEDKETYASLVVSSVPSTHDHNSTAYPKNPARHAEMVLCR